MLKIYLQKTSRRILRPLLSLVIISLFTWHIPAPATAAVVADYSALPPFLTTEVTPNVMFMLDNSGSMKVPLYRGVSYRCNNYGDDFVSTGAYYGIFDDTKKYKYDDTIPIDISGYDGSAASSYTIDVDGDGTTDAANDVAAFVPGAFVEDVCTPGIGKNCWDGNFLNWMVTRRIDAARKVMIGGKVESRAGYDYTGDGSLEWKLVGNNERSDGSICKTDDYAQTYTPFPDDAKFKITSPAESGAAHSGTGSPYDPYAKIAYEAPSIIRDKDDNIIGEHGIVTSFADDAYSDTWHTVTLQNSYTNPVVIATPLAYNGVDPSVARVNNVKSGTPGSFGVRAEEWEYKDDGGHANEAISYMVIEAGSYTLIGGEKIIAGNTDVKASAWKTIDTSGAGFPAGSQPVVLTTVITNRQDDTVTTRLQSVDDNSFEVKLQEEQDYLNRGDNALHPEEVVAYIALEQGSYSAGGPTGSTRFEAGTVTTDENWKTISFTPADEPHFLASMQTYNGSDPATLRYKNLNTSTVEVFVEEEKSADTEMGHADEDIGYVIVSTDTPRFNLALLVDEEPTGLLHDVYEKVRLGISFYKYEKDADIYNGELFNGGTLQLSIPYNPFIKGPVAVTGFRDIATPVKTDLANIVDAIEHYPLVWGTTPLAENYFEIIRYFQQVTPYYDSTTGSGDPVSYQTATSASNNYWDPYWYEDPNDDGDTSDSGLVSCAKSYILLFTDGQPYKDGYVPDDLTGYDFKPSSSVTSTDSDFDEDSNGGDCFTTDANDRSCENNLNDLAKWANCADPGAGKTCSGDERDLRTDMDGEQNLITYTVAFGQTTPPAILQSTADVGGGIAYAAEDGGQLKDQLTNAFNDILGRKSGTAASVISNTRSGEGAIYQSIFYPMKEDDTDVKVHWIGQIHALLVDAYGNMREDSNDNNQLDILEDYFIVFDDDGVDRYKDADENQQLPDPLPTTTCTGTDSVDCLVDTNIAEPEYLWNTTTWLNDNALVPETQRSYLSNAKQRYIFTWIDAPDSSDNRNNIVDSGEVQSFEWPSTVPSVADLSDPANIYPYLQLYPSFSNRPASIAGLSTTNFNTLLVNQTERQINWIRGLDDAAPLTIGGSVVVETAMRSRQFNGKTWRLGDIVYSTPTLVGRPAEGYHLLYRDASYAPFAAKYQKRRNVIYTGANDGMVHAFNGGFFNSENNEFLNSIDEPYTDSNGNDTWDTGEPLIDWDGNLVQNATMDFALGAELWAYVPFNLLPHLYWLTEPMYDEKSHVYYVDQKPRIFDAKIFPEESNCRSGAVDSSGDTILDQVGNADCDHPNGWGTVMAIGMRFGGGSIIADMDKTDGSTPDIDDIATDGDGVDPTMKSAVILFDITNPEKAPKLLAEIAMPNMGFATSYPTVVVMKDGNKDKDYAEYDSSFPTTGENRWFLAFGSGPADGNGDPGGFDTAGNYDKTILDNVESKQNARFFMLDLVQLATNNALYTLGNGGTLTAGLTSYVTLSENNSFISDSVTVDYDLDYNADAVYFGTISGDSSSGWGGKLRRILIDNDDDPTTWLADNTLIDVGQPITAAPSVGVDDDGRNWIFFGTGRYFNVDDKSDTSQQSYYGIKEPVYPATCNSGSCSSDGSTCTVNSDCPMPDPLVKSWDTVTSPETTRPDGPNSATPASNGLVNVSNYQVFANKDVSLYDVSALEGLDDWDGLVSQQADYSGWYLDFPQTGERNIGQAALIGGLLSFTTFTPDAEICNAGGTSDLWALYYKTGTAHYTGVLDVTSGTGSYTSRADKAKRTVSLGKGLATSPSIHTGREQGSAVFVQSSTGKITKIEEDNPLQTKSGMKAWKMR